MFIKYDVQKLQFSQKEESTTAISLFIKRYTVRHCQLVTWWNIRDLSVVISQDLQFCGSLK